jgi:hypothetical protein
MERSKTMSTYKYVNGALEPIEPPEFTPELKWGPVGDPSARNGEDYAWYCGLPAEAFSAGLAEGFSISVYRATTDRAPYPFMAFVDLSDEGPDEIHFPELRDLIAYAREHAQLLQLTVLAGLADRIDEAMIPGAPANRLGRRENFDLPFRPPAVAPAFTQWSCTASWQPAVVDDGVSGKWTRGGPSLKSLACNF